MMDIQQKALIACKAYADTNKKIKRLGNEIGALFSSCIAVQSHKWRDKNLTENSWNCPQFEPCLKKYYQPYVDDDGTYYMTDVELREALECPHCLAAHDLIQERKKARKTLGAAKRAITMIGRKPSSPTADIGNHV